jgi:hypothetical protein
MSRNPIPSNVIVGGSTTISRGACSYEFLFNPPENVAGKVCILSVYHLSLDSNADNDWVSSKPVFVELNGFSQSSSFVSVNDPIPPAQTVYIGNLGFAETTNTPILIGVYRRNEPMQKNEIIVSVPTGPTVLTVNAYGIDNLFVESEDTNQIISLGVTLTPRE